MAVVEHQLLRTLHRMHRQVSDLQSRIDRGPKQLNSKTALVKEADEKVSSLKESLKKTQLLANEKQLLLKQREEKILDFKGKLNAAKSNEEFQAFKNQIAADEQANEVLSDEIFEQLEKIDELNSQIVTAKEELESANQEFAKVKKKVEDEEQGLRDELSRINGPIAQNRIPGSR